MNVRRSICLAAGVLAGLGAASISIPSALASATRVVPAGMTVDIGPSPTGVGACPFLNQDASFMFESGNGVSYGTENKNGDWGGFNAEGIAVFQEAPYNGFDSMGNPIDTGPPVGLYTGHVHIWEGGGNNAKAQSENGFTLDFQGSGPLGTIDLHVNGHTTTNASGAMTANSSDVKVTCS